MRSLTFTASAAPTTSIALLLTLLAACTEPTTESPGTTFSDSAGIPVAYTRISATSPTCELSEPTVRIGSVAGDSANQLFGVRDAVRLDDGRIAVLNAGTDQIKIFDPRGELVRQFGRRGRGPGEFKLLWSLDLRGGDTLVVGEYRPWRFSFFTRDGEFLRSVEARPAVIERPDVGIVLSGDAGSLVGERCCFTGERQGFDDQTMVVKRYQPDGALIDTLGVFWFETAGYLSRELRYVGGPIFGARASFAHYPGDTLAYASGRSEQVELWSMDGRLERLVRWRARERDVRAEDGEEWRRRFRENFSFDLSSERARMMLEAQVGHHRPVADSFPALANWNALLVSPSGHVWVKEFRRPSDEGPDRWLGFRPGGGFHCQLMLPEGLLVLNVGDGYILGVERDELDVEYLVEHRFRGGAVAGDVEGG